MDNTSIMWIPPVKNNRELARAKKAIILLCRRQQVLDHLEQHYLLGQHGQGVVGMTAKEIKRISYEDTTGSDLNWLYLEGMVNRKGRGGRINPYRYLVKPCNFKERPSLYVEIRDLEAATKEFEKEATRQLTEVGDWGSKAPGALRPWEIYCDDCRVIKTLKARTDYKACHMAIRDGWRKSKSRWHCPACLKAGELKAREATRKREESKNLEVCFWCTRKLLVVYKDKKVCDRCGWSTARKKKKKRYVNENSTAPVYGEELTIHLPTLQDHDEFHATYSPEDDIPHSLRRGLWGTGDAAYGERERKSVIALKLEVFEHQTISRIITHEEGVPSNPHVTRAIDRKRAARHLERENKK